MKKPPKPTPLNLGTESWRATDLSIPTYKTHYTKRYEDIKVLGVASLGAATWAWLSVPLREYEKRAKMHPISETKVELLWRGLLVLKGLKCWKELVQQPAAAVTLHQLKGLYKALEAELAVTITFTPNAAARTSNFVRSFLTRYLTIVSLDKTLSRIRSQFKSKLTKKSSGRALISQIPDGQRHPIGATPHKTIEDYIQKRDEILKGDLNRIEGSAVGLLRRYELALLELERLKAQKIPEDSVSLLIAKMSDPSARRLDPLKLPKSLQEDLLALTVQVACGLRPNRYSSRSIDSREWIYPLHKSLVPILKGRLFDMPTPYSVAHLVNIRSAPPVEVLIACALVLQIHTKWNIAPVLRLNASDVAIVKFPHQLQSIKTKTGELTPRVFVDAKDESVVMVCRILHERMDALRASGVTVDEQSTIWASSRSISAEKKLTAVVGWSSGLRRFCDKYGLPDFSFEQVRVQALAALEVETGDIRDVQHEAGHALVGTSRDYVDRLMTRLMNEAIMLEFERRLDGTFRYMMDPKSVHESQRLISYPLKDGTGCKSISAPPDDAWLVAGVCDQRNCNRDGGCLNRDLTVTESRMEEVVLMKNYYLNNWSRLWNENPDGFRVHHEPAMVFNMLFYGLLKKGPYRHLISKYEAKAKV